MAIVTYNGASANYAECTDNYNKALEANRLIDGIADNISSYKKTIKDINTDCTNNLKPDCTLLSGIRNSIVEINTLIKAWEDSYPAMKESNLEEAKKVDEEITNANREQALNGLKAKQKKEEE